MWLAAHFLVTLVLAAALATGCMRTMRGPRASPRLARHSAVAIARAALRLARGVEAPRSIVAASQGDARCRQGGLDRRVACHLARPETLISAEPIERGWRVTFALPQLSDHLHQVVVREHAGRIEIVIDSVN